MKMKNIRHSGIVVTDMERSLKFYRDLLGLKPMIDFEEKGAFIDSVLNVSGVYVRMVKLITEDEQMIELLQYYSHPIKRNPDNKIYETGPTHVAFTVEDVNDTYARFSEEDVRCNSAPVVAPDGKAKLFFCQDPDGTYLEIVQMLDG